MATLGRRVFFGVQNDHLVAERQGRAPQVLIPESGDVFFTPGRPRTRRVFTRAADGSVSSFAEAAQVSLGPATGAAASA